MRRKPWIGAAIFEYNACTFRVSRGQHGPANEVQNLFVRVVEIDRKPVFRDALPRYDLTKVESEVREPCQATALFIKHAERELPTRLLRAAMLPDDPVEPALNTTRQIKISWVNAQHQTLIDNPVIEPVW